MSASARMRGGLKPDPATLALAAGPQPGALLYWGDMTRSDLGRRFNIVVRLFGSLAYARYRDALRRAVEAMGRHTTPGGVVIDEPWLRPDRARRSHFGAVFVDQPDLNMEAMRVIRGDGVSILDFHYLVMTGQMRAPHGVLRAGRLVVALRSRCELDR